MLIFPRKYADKIPSGIVWSFVNIYCFQYMIIHIYADPIWNVRVDKELQLNAIRARST